ncbi:hypothetical protein [Aquibaculum sediminis]|uniref:hypothetical protein n=1 Tax=Aquibaculum sediminis TaxID=3231907 RepID=UPI003453C843
MVTSAVPMPPRLNARTACYAPRIPIWSCRHRPGRRHSRSHARCRSGGVTHDSQAVKEAVVRLSTRQATEFPREHRPWGWYEPLAQSERFQVKRIVVHPGASLSLQSHHHRKFLA